MSTSPLFVGNGSRDIVWDFPTTTPTPYHSTLFALTSADEGRDRNAFSASAKELWNCPSRASTSDRISKPVNPFGAVNGNEEEGRRCRLIIHTYTECRSNITSGAGNLRDSLSHKEVQLITIRVTPARGPRLSGHPYQTTGSGERLSRTATLIRVI